MDAALADLRQAVGDAHVITGPSETAGYATDWTGRFLGATPAVVRPGDAAEVAAVVEACARHDLAIVPQGGNTGLVGGSVPLAGEIVVSLRRLASIDVDPSAGQLTAGAGATIADVQAAARDSGWDYGVDWAARDSATVGGSVATNAGGVRVIRHGDTRANLLGVEAVLADASTISRLGGLVKDNTGYALHSLLCGSEGTLGLVTAARLRLVAPRPERVVALIGFASVGEAVEAVGALRRDVPSLEACELVFADGVNLVAEALGTAPPFQADASLLVECADVSDPTQVLAEVAAGLGTRDVAVATEPRSRAELWRWREHHTEVINRLGPPIKLDVTVPQEAMAAFVRDVRVVVAEAAPTVSTWLFGHAADGNLHVNVTGWTREEEQPIEDSVLRLVVDTGGSISAEHGIGTVKRPWLAIDRSRADLDAMRAIKRALDPQGILNPNVLLPPPT